MGIDDWQHDALSNVDFTRQEKRTKRKRKRCQLGQSTTVTGTLISWQCQHSHILLQRIRIFETRESPGARNICTLFSDTHLDTLKI